MEVKEYKLVNLFEPVGFNDLINNLIKEGWQPFGGVATTVGTHTVGTPPNARKEEGIYYAQAMVKY